MRVGKFPPYVREGRKGRKEGSSVVKVGFMGLGFVGWLMYHTSMVGGRREGLFGIMQS